MPGEIIIERLEPAGPNPEVPFHTRGRYKMADPREGADRHIASKAIYVKTLPEVRDRLVQGLSLWMKQDGKRETLIAAHKLRVTVR